MQNGNPHAKKICGASTRTGGLCQNAPMPNGRCRMHGGKTPRGHALPQTTHGRYSKHLPTRLAALYDDTAKDSELLSVRQDIRLIDALILANFGNLDTGESKQYWDEMLKWILKARVAYKSENYATLEQALDEMEAITDGRRLHYATEQEIRDKVEQRRKLVETEQKISLQGERAINVEQLMLLMSSVLQVITSVVKDTSQRNAIAYQLEKLISREPSVITLDSATQE